MIIIGLVFTTMPEPIEFGDKKHVPINIQPFEDVDSEGQPVTKYTADVVENVSVPVTVGSIVEAAVAATYTPAEREAIINGDKTSEAYKQYVAFTTDIRQKAIAAGYID